MSRRSSTISTNGSSSGSGGSASSNSRPTLRTGDQVVAAFTGRPGLTADNLARNDSFYANQLRTCQAQGNVDAIARGAASLGFDLPAKAQRQLLERYSEVSPMQRFAKGTEGGVGGRVDSRNWRNLVARDPLAADIEAEVCATSKKRKGRQGRQ